MKIGELAKRSGIAASAIRYYEQAGLLPAVARAGNGYRDYHEHTLVRLQLIQAGQAAGFRLEELRQLLPSGQVGWQQPKIQQALSHKIAEIEQLERQLAQTKQQLQQALTQVMSKPDDLSCQQNAELMLAKWQTNPA